ncbi:hypothetical protein QTL97_08570 [Sporosarcina thermotolerans]|uniref:Prolipoprotein diacylglyceryl transferase n=1 Tax=Sporosarcina thermotolerans TaxID=633404 RepID=A0AAW9A673_9BACL|nr:hypothetical protein [Sporosarcina thermotolerans]MDW0116986.1 hypothetical protein [Sporosarcina thermotolerans]WHT47903.1 hypothetical protein QNH10_17775 [Sporosarcina thermotolerans]
MLVTKLYVIGNITVPSNWIALIVAFIIAYSIIRLRLGKVSATLFSDAVFYIIIIWKLSVIITDFSTVIRAPISIVYFNGGFTGFCLGLLFVAGRIWFDWIRGKVDKESLVALFTGAVTVQTIFQVMMVLLNKGSLIAGIGTVVIFIALTFFVWRIEQIGDHIALISMLFMAAHIFVATIQPKGLLNPPLFITLIIGVFFIAIFKVTKVQTERGSGFE